MAAFLLTIGVELERDAQRNTESERGPGNPYIDTLRRTWRWPIPVRRTSPSLLTRKISALWLTRRRRRSKSAVNSNPLERPGISSSPKIRPDARACKDRSTLTLFCPTPRCLVTRTTRNTTSTNKKIMLKRAVSIPTSYPTVPDLPRPSSGPVSGVSGYANRWQSARQSDSPQHLGNAVAGIIYLFRQQLEAHSSRSGLSVLEDRHGHGRSMP